MGRYSIASENFSEKWDHVDRFENLKQQAAMATDLPLTPVNGSSFEIRRQQANLTGLQADPFIPIGSLESVFWRDWIGRNPSVPHRRAGGNQADPGLFLDNPGIATHLSWIAGICYRRPQWQSNATRVERWIRYPYRRHLCPLSDLKTILIR